MGFKQTSEGRVFFKGPDNDDAPPKTAVNIPDPVIATDQTQMQILLLLKSLNTKIKDTKAGSAAIKKQLLIYKATIKELEEKTAAQEKNYIELEQNLSRKHSETDKKTQRVEQSVKETQKQALEAEERAKDALKKLEEARNLVKTLEEKYNKEDTSLEDMKSQLSTTLRSEISNEIRGEITSKLTERQKEDEKILARQKYLEKQQKEQGEKMVNSVAAYVTLTKRVSETEARQVSLDNKIEEATAEFIKLDRKIDKALEDRTRMLRKIERIENAVLETRDALNAKAMVLLTNQGSIGGIEMPRLGEDLLQTDPVALNRRMQEEALMPWWRRPVRLQAPTLVMLFAIVLMGGWIIGEMRFSSVNQTEQSDASARIVPPPSKVSSYEPQVETLEQSQGSLSAQDLLSPPDYAQSIDQALDAPAPPAQEENEAIALETPPAEATPDEMAALAEPDYGIKIHKGTMGNTEKSAAPAQVQMSAQKTIDTIDIQNEDQMLAVLEQDPEMLAARLNEIEPGTIPPAPKEPKVTTIKPQEAAPQRAEPVPPPPMKYDNAYKQALKTRIPPDNNLPDVAKRIEEKAYDGIPEAQHDMGAIYVAGHGNVKKDTARAIQWFEEAAKNGVANARYNLGVLYHQGIGVSVDISRAMGLYAQAAQQGHPEAQYNLGIAHIEGIGVPYDPQKAAHYFELGANQGITEAAYNLGLIYENGLLGDTRPDDALMWYKTAADKGSPEAHAALDQLAKSLGISLNDVNRIVERVRQSKQASASPQALGQSAVSYTNTSSSPNITAQIQAELLRRGLYSGVIDGVNGPMTSNAIKAFEAAASLDVTGQPSDELLKFLKASAQFSTNSL